MQHFANTNTAMAARSRTLSSSSSTTSSNPTPSKKINKPNALAMDTGQLFEQYTIEEIRKVERETRVNIEKKKEDLRQMVGERYRDLIDAADTISDMKSCTEKIVTAVQGMQGYCTKMHKTHMTKGVLASRRGRTDERSSMSEFYAVAAQTKLLMDMPEKIWSAVENNEHLRAVELYLLSCHIVTSLQLNSNTQQSSRLLAWLPVLSRQWAAISHFKASILQSCRKLLKNSNVSDQDTAKALCSIMLLEESSPRQVFTEFLLARTATVQHCFHANQHGLGVKGQICSVAELICVTIKQIYAVFYQGDTDDAEQESCNLLLKTLKQVTNEDPTLMRRSILQSEMSLSSFTKHLPSSVINFCPSTNMPSTAIASAYLQQSVQQWLETCLKEVHSGIGQLLVHVTSMKALASIRDAVWDLLVEDGTGVSWSTVSRCVVNRYLSPWGEFIRPVFLTRIQAIIQDALDQTSTSTQRHTDQALSNLNSLTAELDVAAYVWSEAPSDTPSPAGWKGAAGLSTGTGVLPAGLYMKARSLTPTTLGICSTLDSKLKELLDDMALYTSPPEQKLASGRDTGPSKQAEPFDKFADTVSINNFLQISCTACLQRLLQFFKNQLQAVRSELDAAVHLGQVQQSGHIVDRTLFLGRLCCAIVELCPNLQKSINLSSDAEAKPIPKPETQSWLKSRLLGRRQPSKTNDSEEDTEWSKLKGQLNKQSQEAYGIWSHYTATNIVDEFKEYLLDDSVEATLKAATHWDAIEIQEESEEGKPVTSKIHLPVQSSWYVQTVLYSLCEEINRIGGHAVSRDLLSGLIGETSGKILALYKKYVGERCSKRSKRSLSQSQSLQLLFDVRFLCTIMSSRGDVGKKNSRQFEMTQHLIERLEGTIDPFDLDVFLPHLQANLNRHTQRSTLLLGALSSPDKHLYTSHRAVPSGYQEQHNVLPLASNQGRFNLLPLTTSSHPSSLQRSMPVPKPHMQPIPAAVQDQTPPPAVLHKSRTAPSSLYSKLGSLKTGWLANIGGTQ